MIISQVALGDQQETGKVSPSLRKATSDAETRVLGSSELLAHLRRGNVGEGDREPHPGQPRPR